MGRIDGRDRIEKCRPRKSRLGRSAQPTGSAEKQRSDPMTAGIVPSTERPGWDALKAHYDEVRGLHLRKLFADDPRRGEQMTAEAAGIYLDYSKNRVTAQTLRLLFGLAEAVGLRARIDAMFRGE